MPHLYLPSDHTEADLVLASQLAEALSSGELWVAWSAEAGPAAPEVEAVLREPVNPFTDALAAVALSIVALVRLLTGRAAAQPTPRRAATAQGDEVPAA
jgi:hypothetical protein